MNTLSLDNYGVVEMDANTAKEVDGGGGCYPGYDYKTAENAGKVLYKAVGEFCDGFVKGYAASRRQ